MYRYEIGEQSCAARLGAKDRDGADNGAGRSGTWGWAEEEEEGGPQVAPTITHKNLPPRIRRGNGQPSRRRAPKVSR
jgi:hypothetical protein